MATKVEFKRVQTDAEVENIDIKDGQLIYTGTGKTYMDYGNQRIPTGSGGSSVDVDTEMSDTSTNAVQNKVIKEYVDSKEEVIVSDTQPTGNDWKLWIDSDEVINSGSEVVDSLEGNETNKAPSVKAVNGIIESGSNTNGNWTKFADGTLIITQKVEITNMPIATSWGSWYMTDRGINPPDFPVNFIEKPCVSLSFGSTTSTAIVALADDTYVNNAGGFRLFRGNTSTGTSGIIFITAIGRWK